MRIKIKERKFLPLPEDISREGADVYLPRAVCDGGQDVAVGALAQGHVLDEGDAAVARDARGAFSSSFQRRHQVVGAAALRVAAVEADERVGATAVALAVAA